MYVHNRLHDVESICLESRSSLKLHAGITLIHKCMWYVITCISGTGDRPEPGPRVWGVKPNPINCTVILNYTNRSTVFLQVVRTQIFRSKLLRKFLTKSFSIVNKLMYKETGNETENEKGKWINTVKIHQSNILLCVINKKK